MVLQVTGCADDSVSLSEQLQAPVPLVTENRLYVASGACYAGGVATSTGALTVSTFDAETGEFDRVLVDYNRTSPGDAPVGIIDYDVDHILVLVENVSGRRVDLVKKDGSSLSTYLINSTALSAAVRKIVFLPDTSLLISKSTAIEKFSPARARVTQGVNPYINAPAAPCATSTTLISSLVSLGNEKIIYAHAGASPNNKLGMIAASGYALPADCLTSVAAPTTTALPTSLLLHSSGHLLVSYGSTTAASNFVYSYAVNAVSNSISGATLAYVNSAAINGPSALAEHPVSGDVYVANGNAAFNTIEKFSFDPASRTMTRAPGQSFIPSQLYTRCVSDMKVIRR